MRRKLVMMLFSGVTLLAGCGESIHWFPGTSSGGGGGGSNPTPAPASASLTDQQADTEVSFTSYTVLGLATADTTTNISVGGDPSSKYVKNSEAPTNAAGTVKNNDTVTVMHTTGNAKNTQVSTNLYIGGTRATYTSTTGTLVFPTKKGQQANTEIMSDSAIVPQTLPAGFTFPATIAIDSAKTTAVNPKIFIGGTEVPNGTNIPAGSLFYFKHTTGASGKTVVTTATVTPSSGTAYVVTFKSISQ